MNQKIRDAIKKAKVRQWQIASEIGICETTLVRWLRYELPKDKEEMILSAIEKVREENGQ